MSIKKLKPTSKMSKYIENGKIHQKVDLFDIFDLTDPISNVFEWIWTKYDLFRMINLKLDSFLLIS